MKTYRMEANGDNPVLVEDFYEDAMESLDVRDEAIPDDALDCDFVIYASYLSNMFTFHKVKIFDWCRYETRKIQERTLDLL
jgi:hypothetical protein